LIEYFVSYFLQRIAILLHHGSFREVNGLANIKSAIKRVKTNEKRRAHNASLKSGMRTAIKNFEALAASNAEGAQAAFVTASKKIDKAANKGLIHKNAASRQKSRLAKALNGVNA
jgi:small subunit ribosomal protein S20